MTFEEAVKAFGDKEYFDLPAMLLLTGGNYRYAITQLSHWAKTGKIERLRRGIYRIAEPWRKIRGTPEFLVTHLYGPSYLSLAYVLSIHGIHPEACFALVCVTPKPSVRFEAPWGLCVFKQVPQEVFNMEGATEAVWLNDEHPAVEVATPEKALLDYFYVKRGEWTEGRIVADRLNNDLEMIHPDKLIELAEKYPQPRILRAAKRYLKIVEEEAKEYEEIV